MHSQTPSRLPPATLHPHICEHPYVTSVRTAVSIFMRTSVTDIAVRAVIRFVHHFHFRHTCNAGQQYHVHLPQSMSLVPGFSPGQRSSTPHQVLAPSAPLTSDTPLPLRRCSIHAVSDFTHNYVARLEHAFRLFGSPIFLYY